MVPSYHGKQYHGKPWFSMENHGFQINIPWIIMENDGFPWKTVVFPWFSMVFHGHHGKISAGLKQVKFTLPLDSFHTLYYALTHPHLIYGLLAWGNANLNLLHKTDILQKRALRTIHNKKYNSPTEPLYKHSGILKISHYQLEVHAWQYSR